MPTASGATIYVAGFEDPRQTQAKLTPERLPVFGGGSRDIELVLWDFAQIRHIEQSAELSRILEETLRERGPIDVRPMEHAPFRVLESANMPAVLIEMGFLTNPAQEQGARGRRLPDSLRPGRPRRRHPVPRPPRRGRGEP